MNKKWRSRRFRSWNGQALKISPCMIKNSKMFYLKKVRFITNKKHCSGKMSCHALNISEKHRSS
jgi:hypothetical protein